MIDFDVEILEIFALVHVALNFFENCQLFSVVRYGDEVMLAHFQE